MLMKLHNRQTGSDRNVQAASREINEICERLKLPDTVKNSALEVYRDVSHCSEGWGGGHALSIAPRLHVLPPCRPTSTRR